MTVAGLRRAAVVLVRRHGAEIRLAVLVTAAFVALLTADAETERIRLPFAMWPVPFGAFLTCLRAWLAAQAVLGLLLNHLSRTGW
ncbi:hypothetical protein [Streptomyces geranii]|uniref:hypothetical protein n=1 Tax=Streptomyces geranii TaxID=2058923 RepID=UPI0018E5070A